jgi:NitT/TauT family transport system substrate-binding protein
MFSNNINRIIIGFLSVFLGTISWCILGCNSGFTRHKESLTIAEASQPSFALLYIAEANGYLEEEGLEVTYKSFTSGKDALNSAINGESDIATVFLTPVVIKSYEGEKLSVISTLHSSTKNTALIVRNTEDGRAQTDLVGKRIGVTKSTNAEFFLHQYLANHGIKMLDVTLVDIKPEELVEALQNRTVDAIATWNPHLSNAVKTFNNNQVSVFYSDVYTGMSVLAGRREVIIQKKEAMIRLLSALIKAEQFKDSNGERAKAIVVERLLNQTEDSIHSAWSAFSARIMLNNVLLEQFIQEAEWFRDAGEYKTPLPDFEEIICPDLLNELMPESVTIF